MQNCPACRNGELISFSEIRTFNPPPAHKPVEVALASSICNHCHTKVTTRDQRACNLVALAGRKTHYGEWLMGEEVLKLRKRYGITQQQASLIFGKSAIAFSRYETENSYPDLTMSRMMALALADANFMKQLSAKAGMVLPLIEKRLTAGFLQALAKKDKFTKKVETSSDTTASAQLALGKCSAFFNKLLEFTKHSMTPSGVHFDDSNVSAANDERFALAA
ncbi:type II TA system antitoxin MqsA family protein [Polaromonas sp. DSR2-3-2]|uniref:type II TA system antitoxin MqsA family protein n=1 Tax=unclassified Polaromonas TaxID=2638319 RepID=UPI003CF3499D